jgi:hypothetical protein
MELDLIFESRLKVLKKFKNMWKLKWKGLKIKRNKFKLPPKKHANKFYNVNWGAFTLGVRNFSVESPNTMLVI